MFDYIKKLQKKTPRQREQITLFVSLGITSLIFAVWATAFTSGLTSTSQETRSSGAAPPFEQLKRNFGYFVDDFNQVVKKMRGGFENSFAGEEDSDENEIFQPRNEKTKDVVEENPNQATEEQEEKLEEGSIEEEEDFDGDLIEE